MARDGEDGRGARKPRGGRDGTMLDEAVVHLLPTPVAGQYGYNQSPTPGASIRPSLDTLIPLLPTPLAGDGPKGSPKQSDSKGNPSLAPAVLGLPTLPTPAARDWKTPGSGELMERNARPLNEAVVHLLPTPVTSDANGTGQHGTGGDKLRTAIGRLDQTPDSGDPGRPR